MFEGEEQTRVRELAQLPTTSALVLFENRVLSSPEYKSRTAVAIGESLTHKSVAELEGSWIHDGSRKQLAVYFSTITKHRL